MQDLCFAAELYISLPPSGRDLWLAKDFSVLTTWHTSFRAAHDSRSGGARAERDAGPVLADTVPGLGAQPARGAALQGAAGRVQQRVRLEGAPAPPAAGSLARELVSCRPVGGQCASGRGAGLCRALQNVLSCTQAWCRCCNGPTSLLGVFVAPARRSNPAFAGASLASPVGHAHVLSALLRAERGQRASRAPLATRRSTCPSA